MNITKSQKIIIGVVGGFLLIYTSVIPYFHKREAMRIVTDVIKYWENGDLSYAFGYWEIKENSPPVYGVESSKILSKVFDKKDGRRHAEITVSLVFATNNILPSGDWVFELSQTRYGWKIINFYLKP